MRDSFAFTHRFLGWLAVTKDEYISLDLENEELQIKTDSILGSGDTLTFKIYDATSDTNIAALMIYFDDAMKYHVGKCTADSGGSKDDFGSGQSARVPTTDKDKTWKITETGGSLRVW